MSRVRIAAASFAATVALLGAVAGAASAEKPSGIHFFKENGDCSVARGSYVAHWTVDLNPSEANRVWRELDCGPPTTVEAGAYFF